MNIDDNIRAARDVVRIAVELDGISYYLKVRPQWVNWRFELRNGRLKKVPYTPGTRCKASCTDLLTWRSFEDAMGSLEDFDGVGFVLCSADPFVGIDFDKCRNPETGEVDGWVLGYIERFAEKYVELSPSGTG